MKRTLLAVLLFLNSFWVLAGGGNNPASVAYVNSKINEVLTIIGANHTIGQSALGGIVYWVDATGRHGLVADTTDITGTLVWDTNPSNIQLAGTMADGVGIGLANTKAIVAFAPATAQAARACIANTNGSQNDWYLPTSTELSLLYQQYKAGLIILNPNGNYWSSEESSATAALTLDTITGAVISDNKINNHYVRCIRAF